MMTDVSLFLWQAVLWGLLGLALLAVTVVWIVIALAVIRAVADFVKAYKSTKDLDEEELY